MSALRAVFFDFGGVLYKTPNLAWLSRLQRVLRNPHADIIDALFASPTELAYVMDIMTGRVPEAQVWEQVAARLRLHPRWLARLRAGSLADKRLNQPMIYLLQSLRPRYQTAILSNAGSDFRETFGRAFPVDRWVDEVIISAEEGLAKPDPRIYTLAVERLGVKLEEALFVDDLEENITAARQAGMRAVQFLNNRQAISEIRAILNNHHQS